MADAPPHQLGLRIVGGLVLVLAFVQIIISAMVYDAMTNVKVGAFWGAILPFIAGVCGVISINRGIVIAACITASLGIVVCLIAAIVDSIAAAILQGMDTCVDRDGKFWGSESGTSAQNAFACATYYYSKGYSCYCNDDSSTCFYYDLTDSNNDCDYVLTTYADNLSASATLLWILFIMSFIFSIFSCVVLCKKQDSSNQSVAPIGGPVQNAQLINQQPQQGQYKQVEMQPGQQMQMQPGQQMQMQPGQQMQMQPGQQMQMQPGQQMQMQPGQQMQMQPGQQMQMQPVVVQATVV